jgi:hypothetical protein
LSQPPNFRNIIILEIYIFYFSIKHQQ